MIISATASDWALRGGFSCLILVQSIEKMPQYVNIRDNAHKPFYRIDYRDPTDFVFGAKLFKIFCRNKGKRNMGALSSFTGAA